MRFDPENPVNQLCAQGMMEVEPETARVLFQQAWDQARSDAEKFTAAHYLARQQPTIADKLRWDELALEYALRVADAPEVYPSLYLNIAKGHEDLGDLIQAKTNYEMALSYTDVLPDDGYSHMIRGGIQNGLARIKSNANYYTSSE